MNAKITLYSEDELVKDIKQFSKSRNTSVSKLVNNFFKTLLYDEQIKKSNSTNVTNSLLGVLKKSDIKESSYKIYLEEKYL